MDVEVPRAALPIEQPVDVFQIGTAIHGVRTLDETFCLTELWQVHLYSYSAHVVVAGVKHAISPGMVSLWPPGLVVRYLHTGPSRHYYAHFRTAAGTSTSVAMLQQAGAGLSVIDSIFGRAAGMSTAAPTHVNAAVWSLLWAIVDLDRSDGRFAPAAREAVQWIESHLASDLRVGAIARQVGLSHNQLTRDIAAATGRTVVAYIRGRRVAQALHLLQSSTLPIAAVASRVGIADPATFSRACRTELGYSPRALRDGAAVDPGRIVHPPTAARVGVPGEFRPGSNWRK